MIFFKKRGGLASHEGGKDVDCQVLTIVLFCPGEELCGGLHGGLLHDDHAVRGVVPAELGRQQLAGLMTFPVQVFHGYGFLWFHGIIPPKTIGTGRGCGFGGGARGQRGRRTCRRRHRRWAAW